MKNVGLALCNIWRWYANASGVLVFSLSVALLVVIAASRDVPVVEPAGATLIHTPTIKAGGTLIYSGTLRRNQSCPGVAVVTFRSDETTPVVVTIRRRIPPAELIFLAERTRYVELPDAVVPGKWEVQVSIDSDCPTRQQLDVIAEFDIEVVQ